LTGRLFSWKVVAISAGIGPDEELITVTQAAERLHRVDGRKVPVCTLYLCDGTGLRQRRNRGLRG
jgi:hypothetical protein